MNLMYLWLKLSKQNSTCQLIWGNQVILRACSRKYTLQQKKRNFFLEKKHLCRPYNAGQKKRNSDQLIFCELPGGGRSTLKVVESPQH